jgi:hypothetical protein
MSRIHPNNFRTTLAADCDDIDTSITLSDNLPTIGAGEWIILTITDNVTYELMKISSNSGAPTYNIVSRGLENTTAESWTAGQQVSIRITKGSVDDKQDILSGLSISTATVATDDKVIMQDTSDSDNIKTVTAQAIANLAPLGDFQLIDIKTASNSASLDFTDLTSSYSKYLFVITDLKPASDNVRLYIRTSANNGSSYDSSAGNYCYVFQGGTCTPADLLTTGSTSATEIHLCTGVGNDTNELVQGSIYLYTPASSTFTTIQSEMLPIGPTGILSRTYGGGARLSAASVDAVQFLFASGNITSGIIYCYGFKNS